MAKIFKAAQIRGLLSQVHNDRISFSKFVEILNEIASNNKKFDISLLDEEGKSEAIKEAYQKINEIVESLNSM